MKVGDLVSRRSGTFKGVGLIVRSPKIQFIDGASYFLVMWGGRPQLNGLPLYETEDMLKIISSLEEK